MKFVRIFLLISTICFGQNEDLETMSWQAEKPILWKNFKGKPNRNNDAAAQTVSGISFGFSIGKTGNTITDFTTNVECLFYPTESWYKPEVATPYILKHEQLHFDITELHALLLRKKISKIKPSARLKSQLNDLYKSISRDSYKMQQRYDDETNHSINKEKQAAWNLYIAKALKKLEAYKTQ
ncbi:MAG: DUF922 domain-containing protein [Winogradskyella sp.]|uniref:DUF922 domain-containing protein n=1 Tax=Winogradskyella sp. TaxID=1883156 RepID=UPI0017BA5EBE|nr:DUF922 domain-containing protein [Winogradskyella sp.]MBT8245082.1 DUF922 domain-containing Zn-dependent protease [Winogradskyella sp.]NNK22446.1 DUF922 domain-containing protein [Winogradskyella sp.]